jgi:hypothetical protein
MDFSGFTWIHRFHPLSQLFSKQRSSMAWPPGTLLWQILGSLAGYENDSTNLERLELLPAQGDISSSLPAESHGFSLSFMRFLEWQVADLTKSVPLELQGLQAASLHDGELTGQSGSHLRIP